MKDKDVKIGMRVIPHSKLSHDDLNRSSVYKRAKLRGQNYLYVADIDYAESEYHNNIIFLLNENYGNDSGDFYYASDFEPDPVCQRKEKIQKIQSIYER